MDEPINIHHFIAILVRSLPDINSSLLDQDVTVDEAIDIVATVAKHTAAEYGWSDKVILTTRLPVEHEHV